MSSDALQGMKQAHEALIAALDANDVDAIEAAVADFTKSVARVRTDVPGAADCADAQTRAAEMQRLSEEAQMRVNFLTDLVRRRLDRLAAQGGQTPALYSRAGR